MAPRRDTSKAQGKRPAESPAPEAEVRRKARFDTSSFVTAEAYKRYRDLFITRKVIPGRDIDFVQMRQFGFVELFTRMGWLSAVSISEPVFPTLVRTFYATMTYRAGGPLVSTVRGVQIELAPEDICRILDVPATGLSIYEARSWPSVPGFEPGVAVQRVCGLPDATRLSKPSASSLTIISRVLHHIFCFSLLPRGGHQDEVSYFEVFLIDSVLTGRRIHLGYLMMRHMMECCHRAKRSLPYGRFLTRVFKDAGVDLSRETDVELPSIYDTYNDKSMDRMGFERVDGVWVRKRDIPGRAAPGVPPPPTMDEEEHIRSMEGGIDPQPGDDIGLDIPPLQTAAPPQGESGIPSSEPRPSEFPPTEPIFSEAPQADIPRSSAPQPPWMELTAQIEALGLRMDHFETTTTSQFTHLSAQQDHILEQQTQLMTFLHSVFPPPPPPPPQS